MVNILEDGLIKWTLFLMFRHHRIFINHVAME